ncbi:hypothetical protein BCD49_30905 [Pseudofrankia sp. EUN1h]|nr:hypothetical protein BCD49_30905 [Pseudofrankia sp. EUN1h]
MPPDRPFVIGRSNESDLTVRDGRVSRRHLMLEPSEGGWAAVDISTNGSWSEGRRMPSRVQLPRTAEFNLGAADGPRITLVHDGATGTAPASASGPGSVAPSSVAPSQPADRQPTPARPAAPAQPAPTQATPAQATPSAPAPGRRLPDQQQPAPGAPAPVRPAAEARPQAPGGQAWSAPVPGAAPPPAAPAPQAATAAQATHFAPAAPAGVPAGAFAPDEAAGDAEVLGMDEHYQMPTLNLGDRWPGTGPMLPPGAQDGSPGRPSTAPGADGRAHPLRAGRMGIGRALTNDIVVGDLLASREHAELFVGRSGLQIVDLGSANGTFVNGQRIDRRVLALGDTVGIGHHLFRVTETQLVEYLDSGDVTFEVEGLSVDIGGTRLLHDVTFQLPGRALLAVIGPSGAGKSTLLNALTGFRPADVGSVRYTGRDLYDEYDELRRRIGYVPQDDILHTALTVRQALEYGAELRFPAETTRQERRARVDAVLTELGLTGSGDLGLDLILGPEFADGQPDGPLAVNENGNGADDGNGAGGNGGRAKGHAVDLVDRQVSTLSGGQRKRTSVALELLTQPTLLYLDEPTSGLDPGLDYEVMESLRRLADGGRTVVVVTHSVAQLELCDYVLVLAKGGHVAYFGPPQHALPFLGAASWSQAFRVLRSDRGAAMLARRYRESEYHVKAARVPTARPAPPPLPGIRQQSVLSQMLTLSRRYLRVIVSDRSYLRLLIAYPFVLGLIPRIIDFPRKLVMLHPGEPNRNAPLVLLVLILCGIFMGASSSVREIVKEREIYRRERAIGLSTIAYLGSKVCVLTVVITAQSIAFTVAGVAWRTPSTGVFSDFPLLEMMLVVAVAAVTSAMMGLVVSALVDNADKTMPLLVLMTMSQLVFTGAFLPVKGKIGLEQLSDLTPARWGYAAVGSVVDIIRIQMIGDPKLNPGTVADPIWRHSSSVYFTDLAGMAGIAVLSIIVTGILLRRLDPRVTRRRR